MSRRKPRGRKGGPPDRRTSVSGPRRSFELVSRVTPKLKAFFKWVGFSGLVTILGWIGWRGLQPDPPDTFAQDRTAILATLETAGAPPEALGRAIADLQRLPRDSAQAALISEDLTRFINQRTKGSPTPRETPCPSPPQTEPEPVAPAFIGEALVALAELGNLTRNRQQVAVAAGANLTGLTVRNVDFGGARFEFVCLRKATLEGSNLRGANLQRAVLDSARLNGASLDSAHLELARLVGVQLIEVPLVGARLTQADLRDAILISADLSSSRLGAANLSGADLSGASLGGAYLRGANLNGVRNWESIRVFQSANLHSVRGLAEDQLEYAFRRGAVSIASEEEWQRVREAYESQRMNHQGLLAPLHAHLASGEPRVPRR